MSTMRKWLQKRRYVHTTEPFQRQAVTEARTRHDSVRGSGSPTEEGWGFPGLAAGRKVTSFGYPRRECAPRG